MRPGRPRTDGVRFLGDHSQRLEPWDATAAAGDPMSLAETTRFDEIRAHIRTSNMPLTEDGAALEFAATLQRRASGSVADHGKWFRWNGSTWRIENTGLAFHYARELARDLSKAEDLESAGDGVQDRVRRFGVRSASRAPTRLSPEQLTAGTVIHGWPVAPAGQSTCVPGLVIQADPNFAITSQPGGGFGGNSGLSYLVGVSEPDFPGRSRPHSTCSAIPWLQPDRRYFPEHALLFGHGTRSERKIGVAEHGSGDSWADLLRGGRPRWTRSPLREAINTRPTWPCFVAALVTASETEDGKAWRSRGSRMTGGILITARFMHRDFHV